MKKMIGNAVGSWVTSVSGTVLGLPQVWAGLAGLFDDDPATGFQLGLVVSGLATLIAFIVARDGNKSSEQVGASG